MLPVPDELISKLKVEGEWIQGSELQIHQLFEKATHHTLLFGKISGEEIGHIYTDRATMIVAGAHNVYEGSVAHNSGLAAAIVINSALLGNVLPLTGNKKTCTYRGPRTTMPSQFKYE